MTDLISIVSEVCAIRSIKLESLPTAPIIAALRKSPEFVNSHCTILTGLGALYAEHDMEQGLDGFVTGFAFPEVLVKIHELSQPGSVQEARKVYQHFLPQLVMEAQSSSGLVIRKEIYRQRGLIASSHVRHRGKNISEVIKLILEKELDGVFHSKGIAIDDTIWIDSKV